MKHIFTIIATIGIFFSQTITTKGWIVFQHGKFLFESNDHTLYQINTSIDHLPVHQWGEFEINIQNNEINSIKFSLEFQGIFQNAHNLMTKAEGNIPRRKFDDAINNLDEILNIYPEFPYLYSTYFTISDMKIDPDLCERAVVAFKKARPRLYISEIANTYFRLYQAYLHFYDIQKRKEFLDQAFDALNKSIDAKADPERKELLLRLKKRL